jgi:hypothetical protein
MARIEGLDSTPDYLSDGTDIITRGDKPVRLAQVPSSVFKERPTSGISDDERKRKQDELRRLEEEEKKAKITPAPTPAPAPARTTNGPSRREQAYAQYGAALEAPAPKFEAPKESFTQMAGLGAMMMMLGAMAGGKTYGSAIGAMNGLAGMFKGYQEGRKEAYNQAKVQFEQSLKDWKENKTQVKEAFNRALKYGSKDISKATADVVAELTASGETTAAELVKKRGLASAAQAFNVASDNADKTVDLMRSQINRIAGITIPTEVGVQLAGETPTGGALTRPVESRADQIRRLREELGVTEPEAPAKPKRESAKASDPQWIKIGDKTYRSTADDRRRLVEQGVDFEYTGAPRSPAQAAPGQSDKLKPTATINVAFDATQNALDNLTSVLKNEKNETLKKEWQDSKIALFLLEPLSDSYLTRAMSQLASSNLSPDVRRLAQLIMQARNAYYLETSGKQVTGNEAMRSFGAVVQPSDSWTSIMEKARTYLEKTVDSADRYIEGYAYPEAYNRRYQQKRKEAMDLLERGAVPAPKARELKEEDKKALEWANQNPTSPFAQQIKDRLGVQ